MSCGVCRFYDVCLARNTLESCPAQDDREPRKEILW